MALRNDRAALRHLGALFDLGALRTLTDGQLLERFATGRGEGAELAFAALVERHGSMVLRVCLARLGDRHDAEDAFQATFLVLVEKARGLWVEDSLAPWLHRVAVQTAMCAGAASARRRARELRAAERVSLIETPDDGTSRERISLLHAEIDRLPERYRVPIVLCDLEGRSCEEAARQLDRPVGTIKSWRARGREQLRRRLVRAGLAPSLGVLASGAAGVGQAANFELELNTAAISRTTLRALADRMIAGEVPASVGRLVKGVLTTMLLGKLRMTAAAVLSLVVFAAGLGAVAQTGAPSETPPRAEALPVPRSFRTPEDRAHEIWRLRLDDAVLILLDNAENLRLIKINAPETAERSFTIGRQNGAEDLQRFRAEVMAAVRSAHQVYWQLAEQHAALWADERAVEQAEDLLVRERSELAAGRSSGAEIAEVRQRLEEFRLNLVTRTSDVITTEGRLRNILGLPKNDGRRIVPVSIPIVVKLTPDPNECRALMIRNQPDLLHVWSRLQQMRARIAPDGGGASMMRNQPDLLQVWSPLQQMRALNAPDGFVLDQAAIRLADSGTTDREKFREQLIAYQQIRRQVDSTLSRFLLEIDADYRKFQTAMKIRNAAKQRLEAQRAFYEEGRITVDRYLDAVKQHANAEAAVARHKSDYNVTLVALEEAKGTLLDHERITVAEDLPTITNLPSRRDPGVKAAAFAEPQPAPVEGGTPPPPPSAEGKTFSFKMTLRVGATPIELSGSVTIPASAATKR